MILIFICNNIFGKYFALIGFGMKEQASAPYCCLASAEFKKPTPQSLFDQEGLPLPQSLLV